MSTYMTHIDFTDAHAKTYSDDGIGAWQPLDDEQRRGEACIDCGTFHLYPSRTIGQCDDGSVAVCTTCYIQRLKDNIDYYRPSGD